MCPRLHHCILISSGQCALACNLVSSHSLIFMFMFRVMLCSFIFCVLVGILTSSYPHILRFIYSGWFLVSSHAHNLIFLVSCTPDACQYPRILTFSYPQFHVLRVLVGILASSHSIIIRFMYSGCLLICSHFHILISLVSCAPGACRYLLILKSSYPQVHVLRVLAGILASSHPHILSSIYSGCLLVSSHPDILVSLVSCTPGACWYPRIFTSSYPQVHVLHVLVDNLASSHPHIANVSSCLENWNQIKTMVLTKKIPAFIEANNGSNKFLRK